METTDQMTRGSCVEERPLQATPRGQGTKPDEYPPPPAKKKLNLTSLIEAIGLFAWAAVLGVGGLCWIVLTVGQPGEGSAWPLGLFAIMIAVVLAWFGKKQLGRVRE